MNIKLILHVSFLDNNHVKTVNKAQKAGNKNAKFISQKLEFFKVEDISQFAILWRKNIWGLL